MNGKAGLLDLFLTFARIGGFTFGGGYAMLPMLQKEVVEQKKWATEEELLDYYAVGQCTPGIIAVNVATFIGQKTRGILGGISNGMPIIFRVGVKPTPSIAMPQQSVDLETLEEKTLQILVSL